MKFGKEFASQMVPEWQEAYMNYNFLKTLLHPITENKGANPPAITVSASLSRKLTLYRAFSGLTLIQRVGPTPLEEDLENQSTLIHSNHIDTHETETMFLGGGEKERMYFRKLDEEFNKVVRFYKGKVGEVNKEADVLSKQMEAFIAFRIKVHHPDDGFDAEAEMNKLAANVAESTAVLAAATPCNIRASRKVAMDIIEEDRSKHYNESNDTDVNEIKPINHNQSVRKHKSRNDRSGKPAPLEILHRITMNHVPDTPRASIKGLLKPSLLKPNQKELKFNKENLKKIEEQLKGAFIEFYHKLRLLKSYSFLNITAFSKIMKKFDKISSRSCSKSYVTMVDNSYLGSCDDVHKLMERLEDSFIKHFCNSNRSKGMNMLRHKPKRERHRATFSLGYFAGSTIALILALILIIRTRDNSNKEGTHQYMETMFPLYSFFGYIVLHILLYGANIYFWRRYRVNYPFIFGLKHGSELGYRQVLLIGFGLAMLALACVLTNLDMEMDPRTGDYAAITELLPLGLLVVLIIALFCPFNILYRSSRFFLLKCAFHGFCAPFYKVSLPDFFVVDQLTSQVEAFRSLNFYICYYGWGDYRHRRNTCSQSAVFNTFHIIVAALPFWLRLLQCLRRFLEENDGMQGINGIKYFSVIVAITTRTAFSLNGGLHWEIIAWISSGIAVIFVIYWDIVFDMGLLQQNSKNPWLREKLLIPHKSVYFVAMALNAVLRCAWLENILGLQISFLYRQNLIALVACLEIIRRGSWNFFRLENEHLNNVGKYRAFKSVPLPFNYEEDDVEDE